MSWWQMWCIVFWRHQWDVTWHFIRCVPVVCVAESLWNDVCANMVKSLWNIKHSLICIKILSWYGWIHSWIWVLPCSNIWSRWIWSRGGWILRIFARGYNVEWYMILIVFSLILLLGLNINEKMICSSRSGRVVMGARETSPLLRIYRYSFDFPFYLKMIFYFLFSVSLFICSFSFSVLVWIINVQISKVLLHAYTAAQLTCPCIHYIFLNIGKLKTCSWSTCM